jgi:SAM-dependent MidA family methyltransferase
VSKLTLPTPPPELVSHSVELCELIRQEIQANGGRIGFDRYFDLCQYAPGLGYYSAGLRKFGAGGDFVTAPELGEVFARCVAHAFAQSLERMGESCILEVGCGSGAFALTCLRELERLNQLPKQYWMLERSADLRQRQQQLLHSELPHLQGCIRWLDAPPSADWQGIVFGNEILDAIAPKRFEMKSGQAFELCVACDESGEFHYVLGERDLALEAHLTSVSSSAKRDRQTSVLPTLPEGYRSEWQPILPAWLASLTASLKFGLVMLFDYGYERKHYYLAERTEGTLVCHYQQRMFDAPFWYPGLVDLSASVDFDALADAGQACGLALARYQSQGEFILSALMDVYPDFAELPERERLHVSRQIRMLTLPGEMGDRVQMMVLQR